MSNLFYVIGPSGAGKDTLMNYARKKINGTAPVIFAHRYITRPADAGNENHVSLSLEEFAVRAAAGLFTFTWESHGNLYGIGSEIKLWLAAGFSVVVNGSRQYLPKARGIFADLNVILIEADAPVIAARLAARGRENEEEIIKRIKRSEEIDADLGHCIRIKNNEALELAGNELVSVITQNLKSASLQATLVSPAER